MIARMSRLNGTPVVVINDDSFVLYYVEIRYLSDLLFRKFKELNLDIDGEYEI